MSDVRQKKKISSTSFLKYFILNTPAFELSDEYIGTIVSMWEKGSNTEQDIEKILFELQGNNKLLEFFKKLKNLLLKNLSEKTAYNLIKVLYKNASRFSRKGTQDLWNSEYDQAETLILNLLNTKFEKRKIQKIVEEIILETSNIFMAVATVLYCNVTRGNRLDNLVSSVDYARLKILMSKRLKSYFIDNNKDIFSTMDHSRWGLILYQWGTSWDTFEPDNRDIVNKYVVSLLENNYEKFSDFIAHHEKQSFPKGEIVTELVKMSNIYNLEKFYSIGERCLRAGALSADKKQSIKLFLEAYKKLQKSKNQQ
ncbi:hypothetical protein ACFL5E_01765 [Candidatus Omnitrophota bacterium]